MSGFSFHRDNSCDSTLRVVLLRSQIANSCISWCTYKCGIVIKVLFLLVQVQERGALSEERGRRRWRGGGAARRPQGAAETRPHSLQGHEHGAKALRRCQGEVISSLQTLDPGLFY